MIVLPLIAEVSGTVCRVDVEVGQTVEADDVILVVESMKMEIPVYAPQRGTITEVLVAQGDAVEEGQTVVVLGQQSP